jgi:SAM-dependent methyltransferase
MPEAAGEAWTKEARELLQRYDAGDLPAGIALMRVAMLAPDPAALRQLVERDGRSAGARAAHADRKAALLQILDETPDVWTTVHAVTSSVSHHMEPSRKTRRIAEIAAAFDRAVAASPEASVALYSLGRRDLLDRATGEIVAFIRALDLHGRDRMILDLGCGTGRMEEALAPLVRGIIGLDISVGMVALARRRTNGLDNADIRLSSGPGLSEIASNSMDCVLCIDVFPYIVLSAPSCPLNYFRSFQRVLKPGGDLLLLNYSYRNDEAADLRDLAALCGQTGFLLLRSGDRPFRHWDGRAFHLRRG